MSNEAWDDIINPKSRMEEFNPNMILLAGKIYINVQDEPGAGHYFKYDPTSAIGELGIPQEHFLSIITKWVEIKGKKIAEANGGIGPLKP